MPDYDYSNLFSSTIGDLEQRALRQPVPTERAGIYDSSLLYPPNQAQPNYLPRAQTNYGGLIRLLRRLLGIKDPQPELMSMRLSQGSPLLQPEVTGLNGTGAPPMNFYGS